MKNTSQQAKAVVSRLDPKTSAGPHAISVAPPAYGIESIDRAFPNGRRNGVAQPAPEAKTPSGSPLQLQVAESVAGSDAAPTLPNRTGLPRRLQAAGIAHRSHQAARLPNALKSGVESLSGMAMNDVRVHYNSSRPAALQALAYAQGTDIHVAPGQERHLPHEAWHIVQQKQGRVRPTMQMKGGVPVNDDKGLEHEADAMAEKALQMRFGKRVENQKSVGDSVQKSNFQGIIQNQRSASTISQPTIQMFRTWGINESARNHYDDGWGARYGITDDDDLKDAILDDDEVDEGSYRVELGVYNGRDCYIRYRNSESNNWRADCHTYTWHCGPAL